MNIMHVITVAVDKAGDEQDDGSSSKVRNNMLQFFIIRSAPYWHYYHLCTPLHKILFTQTKPTSGSEDPIYITTQFC